MQFSIEVLPAPFGPMMARISLLRMSKDTSVSAFTPPNFSDTFSTASSTSPLARSGPSGALMARPLPLPLAGCASSPAGRADSGEARAGWGCQRSPVRCWRSHPRPGCAPRDSTLPTRGREKVALPSRRLLQRRRLDRVGLHIPDRHPRGDHAFPAVLERDLGGDVRLRRPVVERLHERRVALGDEAAAHLLGAGEFAVVGVEFLVEDQES